MLRLFSRIRRSTLAKESWPVGSGCSTDSSGLYPPVVIPSSGTGAVASPVVWTVWDASSAESAWVSGAASVCSSGVTAPFAFSPAAAVTAHRDSTSARTSSSAILLFFICSSLPPRPRRPSGIPI